MCWIQTSPRALGLVVVLVLSAGAVRADVRPTVRHRFPPHEVSLLVFKNWSAVPLSTGPTTDPSDPRARGLVGRFFEPRQDVGAWRAAMIEVYVVPRAPSAAPGVPDPARREMREILAEAASLAWSEHVELRVEDAKPLRSKDGVAGLRWSVVRSREDAMPAYGAFGAWELPDLRIGVWASGTSQVHDAPFEKVLESVLCRDAASKASSIPSLDGVNLPEDRRSRIEQGLVKGWEVLVSRSKRYVVLYNARGGRNTRLARIVAERIDLLRDQLYERDFPPLEPFDDVAVVRICADEAEYLRYGGPRGSAGYWSRDAEELVFYDASPLKAPDDDTLSALYHEAFHQYIHYSAGGVAPQPWFDEGHGDYYAGAKFQRGSFRIEPFAWRVEALQRWIPRGKREGGGQAQDPDPGASAWVPLARFLRMNRAEYYEDAALAYAQGWSFVYFLREIVPRNPDWNSRWGRILDRYFRTLQAEFSRLTEEEQRAAAANPPPAPRPAPAPSPAKPRSFLDEVEEKERRRQEPPAKPTAYQLAISAALAAALDGVDIAELEAAWRAEIVRLVAPR